MAAKQECQTKTEKLVTDIRAHLREAELHRQRGLWLAEDREREVANKLMDELLEHVKKLLDGYAWKFFGCHSHYLLKDLVSEMVLAVIREVQRLDDTPHTQLFEENFTLALKACLVNATKFFNSAKACYNDSPTRAALKEQTYKTKNTEANRARFEQHPMPMSFDALRATDEGLHPEEFLADPTLIVKVEDVIDREVLAQLYNEISLQDRLLIEAMFRGYTIEEAAKMADIPLRTAFDHRKKLYRRVCELFGIAQNSGGSVDELASEFKLTSQPKRTRKIPTH